MKRKQEKLLYPVCLTILWVYFCCLPGCATQTSIKVEVTDKLNQSEKPTVAVLNFKPDPSIEIKKSKPFVAGLFLNPDAGNIIANIFSRELSKSGLFTVLARKDVTDKLENSGYNSSIDSNIEIGSLKRILGVDAIIAGTFKRFGFLYPTIVPRMVVKFHAEYIDLRTNKKIWHIKIKGQSSTEADERETARKKIEEAIKKLQKELYSQK